MTGDQASTRRRHHYELTVTWTGDDGTGTSQYRAYRRDHEIRAGQAPPLPGSADPAFRGDPARYNPEQLLVASLSACHMLWYLHLCATNGVVVTGYEDTPEGTMEEDADGGGRFVEVVLHPRVRIATVDRAAAAQARDLHHDAHRKCFVANSMNFPVRCEPSIETAPG